MSLNLVMAAVVLIEAVVLMALLRLRESAQLGRRMVVSALLVVRTVTLVSLTVVMVAVVLMAVVVLMTFVRLRATPQSGAPMVALLMVRLIMLESPVVVIAA